MPKQQSLNIYCGKHGGRRPGSGRKRQHSPGVAHRERPGVSLRTPLHVNFKYRVHIRNKEFIRILKRAVLNSRGKGLRIIHYSVQRNHCHFIVEAENKNILSSGMRSLVVTLARGINQGKVQLERYHLHVLKTLTEMKRALLYVLFNGQKHTGQRMVRMDDFCSLRFLNDVKAIVRKQRMTLIWTDPGPSFLDRGSGFGLKRAEEQLIS